MMNRYFIIFFAATVLCLTQASAQTGRRKRTVDNPMAELLRQLPTQKDTTYTHIIERLAASGEDGLMFVASQLSSDEDGMKVLAEDALGGMTDYILTDGNGKTYLECLRNGLVKAIARNSDAQNKLYLLSLFARCATSNDIPTFIEMMGDPDLTDAIAVRLSSMKSIDRELTAAIRSGDAPHASLARIIEARKTNECEDLLMAWTKDADDATLTDIYHAMAVTGSEQSLNLLAEKAALTGYKTDASHATDAYIMMLERFSDSRTDMIKRAAKDLMTSSWPSSRCAGLRLWIKADRAQDTKTIIKALKDGDKQYRKTALESAIEYGDRSILSTISSVYGKLDNDTKTEVMHQYGRNNATECMNDILKTIKKSDGRLYAAALQAAAQIGGEKALQAIIAQISKDKTGEAVTALLGFNGDIGDGMTDVFKSKKTDVMLKALEVAAERRVEGVYENVKKLLTSNDARLRDAAYDALGGVATIDNVDDLCALLDRADATTAPKIQKAMARALKGEDGESIYRLAEKAMQSSSTPELYYPLMALSGTDKGIATLQGIKSENAEEALIYSDNPKVLPVMMDMARRRSKGAERDKILSRYLTVVDNSQMTPEEKYLMLCAGNETGPADKQLSVDYVRAIGRTATLQALGYMRNYYDMRPYMDAVAESVKEIVAQDGRYNCGRNVRAMLEMARKVYDRRQIDDAGATVTMNEISEMLTKTRSEGYRLSNETTRMGRRGFWKMNEDFENFELSFDWKTRVPMVITLRSMPLLTIDNEKGLNLAGTNEWKPYKSMGEWNTAFIRMVDDTLTVCINGHKLITGMKIKAVVDGKPLRYVGNIAFGGGNDSLTVRYTRICKLPSKRINTPATEIKQSTEDTVRQKRAMNNEPQTGGKPDGYIPGLSGRKDDLYASATGIGD